jgi:hypothetical protein
VAGLERLVLQVVAGLVVIAREPAPADARGELILLAVGQAGRILALLAGGGLLLGVGLEDQVAVLALAVGAVGRRRERLAEQIEARVDGRVVDGVQQVVELQRGVPGRGEIPELIAMARRMDFSQLPLFRI